LDEARIDVRFTSQEWMYVVMKKVSGTGLLKKLAISIFYPLLLHMTQEIIDEMIVDEMREPIVEQDEDEPYQTLSDLAMELVGLQMEFTTIEAKLKKAKKMYVERAPEKFEIGEISIVV
jgi:hypothetical protein